MNSFARGMCVLIVFLSSIGNIQASIQVLASAYRPGEVILGIEPRREYLSYTHPGMDPYPATRIFDGLKSEVQKGNRILIVADEKTSTCDIPFLANGVFDESILLTWIKKSPSAEGLYQEFIRNRVSHIVINWAEAQRLAGYHIFKWPPGAWGILCAFWEKHVDLERVDNIEEKLFGQRMPVFIHSVHPEAASAKDEQVSFNPLLRVYENYAFPIQSQDGLAKRVEFYRGLQKDYPEVEIFQLRLKELIAKR